MNISFYISRRYLFSPNSKNAVNVLTAVSILGVAIGTLALILVLSVFNGFESLIKSMYHQASSDFFVRSISGKTFSSSLIDFHELKSIAPWESIQEIFEEKVLLRQEESEKIAIIKGISQWPNQDSLPIEKYLVKGNSFRLYQEDFWAIISQSLAYTMSISLGSIEYPVKVFAPNIHVNSSSFSSNPFKETFFYISGIYNIQADYDDSYIYTSLSRVQDFFDKKDQISSIEFQLPENDDDHVQEKLESFFGEDFEVLNRFQQHEFLYKVLQTEKWAIFFILTFILLIACFNIVGSVVMILLEKRKDIKSLWAMGASENLLQKIFFYEGILVSFFGGLIGIFFGVSLCLLQEYFGFIKLGSTGDFIVSSYPIEVQFQDVIVIGITLLCISLLITYIPVKILKKRLLKVN